MWSVKVDGDEVRQLGEGQIVGMLRKGELQGHEMVLAPGADRWERLVDTPLYVHGQPHVGNPRHHLRQQTVHGLMWHAVAFGGVVGVLWLQGASVGWSLWWLLALFFHAVAVVQRLRQVPAEPQGAAPPVSVGRSVAARSVPPAGTAPLAPLALAVDTVLGELPAGSDDLKDELEALRAAGQSMAAKRARLEALVEPAREAALQAEAEEIAADLAATTDARTLDVLEAQQRAVAERLEAMGMAREALIRLKARERTLLHEVESLRLVLTQRSAGEGVEASTDQARRLRETAEAEAEVDEALAAGLRAVRTGRRLG